MVTVVDTVRVTQECFPDLACVAPPPSLPAHTAAEQGMRWTVSPGDLSTGQGYTVLKEKTYCSCCTDFLHRRDAVVSQDLVDDRSLFR